MPTFSKTSLKRLKECHPVLQVLCARVILDYDFTVLCGFRGEVEQNRAFADGKSKLKFPKSLHNKTPAMAVDLAPYPVDWNNLIRFKELGILMKMAFERLDHPGWKLQWGGDWKKFQDYPHFELRPKG